MNRLLSVIGCAAMVAPSVASAALDLRIGPNRGQDAVDDVVAPGSAEHYFDLTFNETPPAENEGLWAYDLRLRAPRPGLTLLRAEKPDNWVIAEPDATFDVAESAPDHLLIQAQIVHNLVDITTGKKAARVYYAVDPDAAPGLYRLTLDPAATVFGNGDPIRGEAIEVNITDPGVVLVTPEPAAPALFVAATALGLRRRRRA